MDYYNFFIKKLNTHEDMFYIHKTLGSFVLINYIYRFSLLFFINNMNLENNFGMVSLGMHGLLSLTSLIFKLSNKRNKLIPIIYPEFRLHNIIFAFRSIFCCLSFYFIQNIRIARIINMFICLFTMLSADYITNKYKEIENTSTMRLMPYDDDFDKEKREKLRKMNSSMQLYATYYMLGNINTAFSPMFAIQFSSFLMTLVKKNIIKPIYWHYLYTFSLWKNTLLALSFMPSFFITMNISCYFMNYWRITKNYNKYYGWLIVFLLNYNLTIFFENTIDNYVNKNLNVLLVQYLNILFVILFFKFNY